MNFNFKVNSKLGAMMPTGGTRIVAVAEWMHNTVGKWSPRRTDAQRRQRGTHKRHKNITIIAERTHNRQPVIAA